MAERWWKLRGDALAESAWRLAHELQESQRPRRIRARQSLAEYEQRSLEALTGAAYIDAYRLEELKFGLAQSLCDTLQARVAGGQRPVPSFLTSDGNWTLKRRARRLGRFCEGLLRSRHGPYQDAWELGSEVLLDAAILGTGVMKPIIGMHGPELERAFAFDIHVDPDEARHRSPLNYFHVHAMDRDVVLSRWGGTSRTLRDAIDQAERYDDADDDVSVAQQGLRESPMIEVVECYRMRVDENTPGKRAVVISNKLLELDDYEYDDPPFVFLHLYRERIGMWARGVVDTIAPIVEEVNETASRLQERMRLCSSKRTYVKRGSVSLEDMQANDPEAIVEYDGDQPPVDGPATPFSPQELEWLQFLVGSAHAFSGVSVQAAQASKPPGVTAAAALRELTNLQDARFAVAARRYEMMFVDAARKLIRVTREHAKTHKDFAATWNGGSFMRSVKWSEASLDADQYQIAVAPVAALPGDPAGRLAMITELFDAGVIQPETYRRLVAWPDLESELAAESSEHDYCEALIERYLDAMPESFDERLDYEGPEGLMLDKNAAIVQFCRAYFVAKRERAPEFNQNLLRRYIVALDALIASAAQATPAPGPGAGGPQAPPSPSAPQIQGPVGPP